MRKFAKYSYFEFASLLAISLLAFELRAELSHDALHNLLTDYFEAFGVINGKPLANSNTFNTSNPARSKLSAAVDLVKKFKSEWNQRLTLLGSLTVRPYDLSADVGIGYFSYNFEELVKLGILYDLSSHLDEVDFNEKQKLFIEMFKPRVVDVFSGDDGAELFRELDSMRRFAICHHYKFHELGSLLPIALNQFNRNSSQLINSHLDFLLRKTLNKLKIRETNIEGVSESLRELLYWLEFYRGQAFLGMGKNSIIFEDRLKTHLKQIRDEIDPSNPEDLKLLRIIWPELHVLTKKNKHIAEIFGDLMDAHAGLVAIVDVKEEGGLSISSLGSEDPTPSSTGPEPSFFKRCASRVKEFFRRR